MNFKIMQDELASRMAEVATTGQTFFSTDEYKRWINMGLEEVNIDLRFLRRKDQINIVNGQTDYSIANDILEIIRVEVNGKRLARITEADKDVSVSVSAITDMAGILDYYYFKEDTNYVISLFGTPNQNIANGLKLSVVYNHPVLVNDTDTSGLPSFTHKIAVFYAWILGKYKDKENTEAQMAMNNYNQDIQKARRRLRTRKFYLPEISDGFIISRERYARTY